MCHCSRASWIVVILLSILFATAIASESTSTVVKANQTLASQPIAFTKNMGQWPDSILFRADAGGAAMWFVRDGIYYQFTKRIPRPQSGEEALAMGLGPRQIDPADRLHREPDSIETAMIKAEIVGANPNAEVVGLDELEYKCNYFLGNEPNEWRTDVPNYATVMMQDIYPGVNATFHGNGGRLECLLGGTPEAVAFVRTRYAGASASQDADGATVLQTKLGKKKFQGMLPITEATAVAATASSTNASSNVALVYSTYLGGSSDDFGYRIAVDGSGNAYVTGVTYSTNYPTQTPYQTDPGDDARDVFVTKLSAAGNSLVYSTYLGGSDVDYGRGIAVDGSGNAYVTGETWSTNYPTQSPYQTDQGAADVFVTKLSAAGNSLVYSTYLGGSSGGDYGWGIAVDGSGNAYVTGETVSTNYPTVSPYQTDPGDGLNDVFVTKLSAAGNSLVYSTYLGGSGSEHGYDIAVNGSGNAYVTGQTTSTNYPTQSPYQTDQGIDDVFVTKLSAAGNSLIYSTYLGGSDLDRGYSIAVDGSDNAYVTGGTRSTNYPTQSPYQTDPGDGTFDAFVTKLSAAGNGLVYSTYLGGSGYDYAHGIAVDGSSNAYVTGETRSTNYPTQFPYQTDPGDATYDAFVTKLSAAGNSLLYSSYLGGNSIDYGYGIALDGSGNVYVTGYTWSTNYPTQSPYQTDPDVGGADVFVTKLTFVPCCVPDTKLRGDVSTSGGTLPEGDGSTDGSDLGAYVDYVFFADDSSFRLDCTDVSDLNNDATTDGGDLGVLVDYIFFNDTSVITRCDGSPF